MLPDGHSAVDTHLSDPTAYPLPSWHIKLNTIVLNAAYSSVGMVTSVTSSHPDPAVQFELGIAVPALHPHVSFPSGSLPINHKDIDTILKTPASRPLPSWHPLLSQFVNIGALVGTVPLSSRISAPWYHPDIDTNYDAGIAMPGLIHYCIEPLNV